MANRLYHPPSKILQRLMVAVGLGTYPPASGTAATSWPIYSGKEPDKPDRVITIRTTTGLSQGREMVGGELLGPVGFQVRVRSIKEADGWVKADEIRTTLSEEVSNYTLVVPDDPETVYAVQCVTGFGDVIDAGFEQGTERRLHTLNAFLTVTRYVAPDYSPSLDFSDARNSMYLPGVN